MKLSQLIVVTLAALSVTCSTSAPPKDPAISEVAARNAALHAISGSTVKDSRMETDKNRLVFSYDLVKKKTPGYFNVKINAMTGSVVGVKQVSSHDNAPAPAAPQQ